MALTDDFSYKLGDTGVVLNPDSLTPPFVDIVDARGFDSAPIRTTERDHEGSDGGFMDAEYERGRPISLEGLAYASGTEVEELLDSLKANWAPSRTVTPLYFKVPGKEERLLFVKPLGCRYDVNSLRRVGSTAIQFQAFAEDPRIYSAQLKNEIITQANVSAVGRSYNRGYDYGYGTSITPDQKNLINAGNRPTSPIMTISGPAPVINPHIINDTLGITMDFEIVIPTGSSLVIDAANHTVLLDGQNRRKTLLEPNWFQLLPGDNYLRFRSETTVSATLDIQYYDAWR